MIYFLLAVLGGLLLAILKVVSDRNRSAKTVVGVARLGLTFPTLSVLFSLAALVIVALGICIAGILFKANII